MGHEVAHGGNRVRNSGDSENKPKDPLRRPTSARKTYEETSWQLSGDSALVLQILTGQRSRLRDMLRTHQYSGYIFFQLIVYLGATCSEPYCEIYPCAHGQPPNSLEQM